MDRLKFRFFHPEHGMSGTLTLLEIQDAEDLDDTGVVTMQSTGLRDCNDKLIFEGDILNDGWPHKIVVEHQITTNNICCGHGDYRDETISGYKFLEVGNYEVIGNIYQNPELIGVSNGQNPPQ
jgi:uncharacterized phage protein (TIGR01671 family)